MTSSYDYIVVGSGIAGLYVALQAADHGSVVLLTKGTLDESNSRRAQGGIAAAVGAGDSPEAHLQDTVEAGAGLCDLDAVQILTTEAADRIRRLANFGVPFDTHHGQVDLAHEAAHSQPRVVHAGGDATGDRIETTLGNRARSAGVEIREHHLVSEMLLTPDNSVRGVRTLDQLAVREDEVLGRFIVFATGGAGQLFRVTTNEAVATGDGVALAYRAGAAVADMEFFQFHPTALQLPGAPPFLISEAVRGEGAVLRTVGGRRFAADYDDRGELAPRDIIARAIISEMASTGSRHVFLDLTHLPADATAARFPTIHAECLSYGIDFTKTAIPVAPAAHYMMGGILTTTWGETSLGNLFACGECACTGVHGANRLASNSLLETVVFGQRVVERTLAIQRGQAVFEPPPVENARLLPFRSARSGTGAPSSTQTALRELMWTKVGLVRNGIHLREAADTLAEWQQQEPPAQTPDARELWNMVLIGRLMAEAAVEREESRGAHFRNDFPSTRDTWRRRLVYRER